MTPQEQERIESAMAKVAKAQAELMATFRESLIRNKPNRDDWLASCGENHD